MDCRTCQPTLLDLAHGELAPELAGAVREHVRGCPSCSAAFDGLQRGLSLSSELGWLEPPRSLRVNAMALAERHLQERALAGAQARASARPRASFMQAVLDFIGRMAAGRQVAMATIFMLVVAVGLSQLPALQRSPSGHGVTVVSPDPEGEAAPSRGLAPAEPLDLAVDARSRRIRSREELAAASNAYAKQEAAAAEAAMEGEQAAVAMAAEPEPPAEEKKADDDPLRRLGDVEDVIAQAPVPAADVSEYELAERMASKAGGAEASSASSTRKAKRASAKPSSVGGLAARDDFAEEAAAPASPAPAKPAAQAAPAQAGPRSIDDMLDGALAGGGAKTQASALSRARNARLSSGCASALPLYEQAAKDSATRGVALIELASCQRELGRIAAARSTLQQAVALPQVASRARSMLDELGPAPSKQAADVASEQPAAAPSP